MVTRMHAFPSGVWTRGWEVGIQLEPSLQPSRCEAGCREPASPMARERPCGKRPETVETQSSRRASDN